MELIKKTPLFFFLLLTSIVHGQVNWMSLEEATVAQKQEPRPIILDAYTVWCGPCKLLDKNTFGNDDVSAYINKHFYAVKFNAEGNENIRFKGENYTNEKYDPKRANTRNGTHMFTRYLSVSGYPTLVFFDEKANYITPVVGYLKPTQLEIYLKLIHQQDYKNIKSQEEFTAYIKDFVPQFKE
ncbi:MAG: thioredoxin family protein [Flavobacteriaceae bacterium]|nr:thioredoxin family protein [Flavobacteriaceae bacterium]